MKFWFFSSDDEISLPVAAELCAFVLEGKCDLGGFSTC